MKTQSCKAKGRRLQQIVRDKILELFPNLSKRDVRSAPMGTSGADVVLSEKAYSLFPFSVECKSLAKVAVYKFYEQASGKEGHPLVVIKQNGAKPLAIIDLDTFFKLLYKVHNGR